MEPKKVRIIKEKPVLPTLYKNVGIYCRVSSNTQEQLNSMAAQVSFFVQLLSRRLDWRFVDIYLDFKSGESKNNRLGFKRMIEDARNKKLDIIMTKSISRFGRNTLDTIQTLRELKDLDVTVIFDQEHLDTSKEDSEMILITLATFAEEENKNRKDNQNWAIKKRLKDGTSEIYSRACFGYTKSDIGELTIDRKQAEIVQNIFTMYLSGMSILGIVKELERQGIKSPTGKDKWCKRTIDTMLSNEKYIGNALVFKTYSIYTPKHKRVQNNDHSHEQFLLNDGHLPIISKEVFDAVQEEKARRSNIITDETGKHRKDTRYSSTNI